MKRFYCTATGATYLEGFHLEIPNTAVEISEDRYLSVIANPSPDKIRSHDAKGLPILIDPPAYVPTVDDQRAAVTAERYKRETAGIVAGGMPVDTDDRSKLLINGAALEAMIDPAYVMNWKTPAGFIELHAEQVIAVARAVRAHVQACFDREAELLQAVADGTYKPAMLEEGWP